MKPLFSVCIPAFGQPSLLERALQSILEQDYENVEIVISDDTPDETVKVIAEKYNHLTFIKYFHNKPALTTPANWNSALDRASGDLKMLLHHDDWLAAPNVISDAVALFDSHREIDVCFGRSIFISEKIKGGTRISDNYFSKFFKQPFRLLLGNEIGIPSNMIMRNTVTLRYDNNYKWLVDLEYYVRLILAGYKFKYWDRQVIFVGIHPDQMTQYCQDNVEIIIRENIYFAHQYVGKLSAGIREYDYFWRLIRNYKIKSIADLVQAGVPENQVPAFIKRIVKVQSILPSFMLKHVLSKISMATSYLSHPIDSALKPKYH